MSAYSIDELAIPATIDGAGDFEAAIEVGNTVEALSYGTDDFRTPPEEALPGWHKQEYEPKRMLVARVDGSIVARAVYETRVGEEMDAAWPGVQVLPQFRRRGIGSALTSHIEAMALADGRPRLLVYAHSPDAPGERLTAPTGFGSVPLANEEVQFLLHRGYSFEQVERGSRLPLPVDAAELQQEVARAAASAHGYRVHVWVGPTPAHWQEDIAALLTRMNTDAPTAGLEEPEDLWTVERLAADEQLEASGQRTAFTAAAEHMVSGKLVGYTELVAPRELSRPVSQEDTIVLHEHRGHRLGMLVKAANLLQLQRVRPGHPSVITFNAEENRHMLSINEALGFEPIGYEGAWKKLLGA